MNMLYCCDNLDVLRKHVADESADLVYLGPPLNSSRAYNVIFATHPGDDDRAAAQTRTFDDTWHGTSVTDQQYQRCTLASELPEQAADALLAFRALLGESDAMAYLVNEVMTAATFGAENFRNDIIWQRSGTKGLVTRRLPSNHDVILGHRCTANATCARSAAFIPYNEADLGSHTAATLPLMSEHEVSGIALRAAAPAIERNIQERNFRRRCRRRGYQWNPEQNRPITSYRREADSSLRRAARGEPIPALPAKADADVR
jgi:hypothetical protein